jgi:hypothetical protein
MKKPVKTEKFFNCVNRFEEILRDGITDHINLMWQIEQQRFTLFGYFVRGEMVINQVMHDGSANYTFTLLRGNTWKSTEDQLKTIFPETNPK